MNDRLLKIFREDEEEYRQGDFVYIAGDAGKDSIKTEIIHVNNDRFSLLYEDKMHKIQEETLPDSVILLIPFVPLYEVLDKLKTILKNIYNIGEAWPRPTKDMESAYIYTHKKLSNKILSMWTLTDKNGGEVPLHQQHKSTQDSLWIMWRGLE